MTTVSFHRLAAKELSDAQAWYAARDSKIADKFTQAVETAVRRIRDDPGSHSLELKRFRWVRVGRFPYRLIFEQSSASGTLILAVAHTSRRPGYWRRR